MKEQIQKILRKQIIVFVAMWVIPMGYAILHEAGILSKGVLAGDAQMDYILQSIGI